jgi:hypothetical protein
MEETMKNAMQSNRTEMNDAGRLLFSVEKGGDDAK